MESLQLDLTKKYSYADYLTWLDDRRRELINGFVKLMTPAPARIHQKVAGNIFTEISNYLKKKKCEVYQAPFDVRLPNNEDKENSKIETVVQPDICAICNPNKLDDRGCLGAPDLIVEIVSPSNSKHDVEDKFELYQKHGVKEYWLVFPHEKTINVFLLNTEGSYELVQMYAQNSQIPVNIFSGDLTIDLAEIFDE